jgi:hypothetical protein
MRPLYTILLASALGAALIPVVRKRIRNKRAQNGTASDKAGDNARMPRPGESAPKRNPVTAGV